MHLSAAERPPRLYSNIGAGSRHQELQSRIGQAHQDLHWVSMKHHVESCYVSHLINHLIKHTRLILMVESCKIMLNNAKSISHRPPCRAGAHKTVTTLKHDIT